MTWKDNEPESSYAHTERRVMTAASDRARAAVPTMRCFRRVRLPRCLRGHTLVLCEAPARAVLGRRADAGNCHHQRRSAD